MKKFLGAIISGLAGVLSLVFLTIPAFSMDMGISTEKYSGWELLKTKDITDLAKVIGMDGVTALTWYRILAWILVIVAIVLVVVAVAQLLSALGIIKVPAIVDTVAKYALIALAVVSILALIANIGIRAEFINYYKDNKAPEAIIKQVKEALSVGAALWIVAIVNAIAAVCGNLFKAKN